jgi:tRNA (cytidine56-2'-O)-methyltransferase
MPYVIVLRIGHRYHRDSRVTTHVCLTARALGADGVIISDREDRALETTIGEVSGRFGGDFTIKSGKPWRQTIREWKEKGGKIIHLTAYGLRLPDVTDEIRQTEKDLLVVVGSEKMPAEVFKLADWNVSVTSQPMSEVGALAVFLDWHFQHRGFDKDFANAKVKIIPSSNQKRIERLTKSQNRDLDV